MIAHLEWSGCLSSPHDTLLGRGPQDSPALSISSGDPVAEQAEKAVQDRERVREAARHVEDRRARGGRAVEDLGVAAVRPTRDRGRWKMGSELDT
jgi:hypothetical protein